MKILVVDVGNTSTAIGLWLNGRVSKVNHIDGSLSEAQSRALQLIQGSKVDILSLVSVVPKEDRKWKDFAKQVGLKFFQVDHLAFIKDHTGKIDKDRVITLDYPKPETIGADRLSDAVGAVSRYGAPVIVMDFGTALTAAAITADRVWRGGVIAPGFPLMRDYLFERTAQLPKMTIGKGKAPKIGRSTQEAMLFGALIGYRGMVREIVNQLRKNFKCEFKLVATGGFARWSLNGSGMPFTIDPTLTLYGAGLICEKLA